MATDAGVMGHKMLMRGQHDQVVEQHGMSCAQPVHLGGTLAYPEQRFPDPLPADAMGVLERLADEPRRWAASR